jgi:L-histidine N-alpha-methyltransferase
MPDQETLFKTSCTISDYLEKESVEETRKLIWDGLQSEPKYISSRFFYDDRGSELFEDITRLSEYYPTRLEKEILIREAPNIIRENKASNVIELGSGDCSKISLLFDALNQEQIENTQYVPVDVSRLAIQKSARILQDKYNGLRIHGILADFLKHLRFPSSNGTKLVCFFGSTLGNFEPEIAHRFLLNVSEMMNPGDQMLLGLDMVKDKDVLEKAYNDEAGVTELFNKNILNVINRNIGSDFNPQDFEHHAFFNEEYHRIEMHLKARQSVLVTTDDGQKIKIKKDEMIHTENSHKFSGSDIMELAVLTGFKVKDVFTDPDKWFSLVHFTK